MRLPDLAHIFEDMPPIENLLGLWRSFGRSTHVVSGTITADEFNPRMILQPLREGFSRALGEQVDGAMRGQINHNRTICLSAAQRKIIHANSLGRLHVG